MKLRKREPALPGEKKKLTRTTGQKETSFRHHKYQKKLESKESANCNDEAGEKAVMSRRGSIQKTSTV